MDSHYTDGIISPITGCGYQDSADNDLNLHSKSLAETNILIKSVSGSESQDCMLKPAEMDIDLSGLNSLEYGNDTVETKVANGESRLSKLYDIQTSSATLIHDTPSVVEASVDGKTVGDKVSGLTCPSWAQEGLEEPERREERHGLDHNELGLRNLCCEDSSEDKITTETEKQLAAEEVSIAMREKSPLRGAARGMDPAGSLDKDSCEGLDMKTKELWSALEEDEEKPGSVVVRGEFDCHRFSQSRDLRLWPDENDQWASPEKRSQDIDLRSEFFSGFSNKAWEVGERLVVGQEFWETEENDELAGSEPHPAVLEGCEEMWNDETQGPTDHLSVKKTGDSKDSDNQQAAQAVHIQQEENIENLGAVDSFNKEPEREISDTEVENVEIPEQETLDQGEKPISSCTETDRESGGRLDSAEAEENQNFNRWPQNNLCKIQKEKQTSAEHVDKETGSNLENYFSHTLQNKSANISICITEAPHVNFSDLENAESGLDSEAEMRPWLSRQYIEESISIMNVEEDYRDMSLPSNPISCPSDLNVQEEIDQQVDNFSSVDFPSPPPSIDLDVQDDKLESFDDSFPSPPLSVLEAEEFISHINLSDFIASPETKTEPYISPAHNTDVSEPHLRESSSATTQSKGISTSLNLPSVHITLHDESNSTYNSESQDEHNNLSWKTSSATTTLTQAPLNNLPELLISEWKDLDEEPLEDFEKLEQLCCISGDEEDTLGELFLGNLELLESLKKTPDQKVSSTGDSDMGEEMRGSSTPEGSRVDLKEGGTPDDCESMVLDSLDSQGRVSPQEERNGMLRSSGQTSDVKDQGSLSKMTMKNGLMMQVSMFFLWFLLGKQCTLYHLSNFIYPSLLIYF